MKGFRHLKVWEKSHRHIAEGCGRGSDAELSRFLQISMESASELEYFLLLAKDLRFLDFETHGALDHQVIEVKKMLVALIKKLKADR